MDVVENPEQNRFELSLDGGTALVAYRRDGQRLVPVSYTHLSCVPRGDSGFAGFASGCRSVSGNGVLSETGRRDLRDVHPLHPSSIPWRLSGLLSGCLPTSTRPQARAHWVNATSG